MLCSSPWDCPHCAPKIAAGRAEALGPQVSIHLQKRGTCWLITLTISHGPTDKLRDLFAAIMKAFSRMTSGRAWQELRDAGLVEYVRGFDVTVGENGWHPHVHLLLLLGPEHGDPHSVATTVRDRWMACCRALGLKVSSDAQDVAQARSEQEATAYAVTPAAVYETTAMAMKRMRGKGSGLTPFEVLEHAVNERAARESRAHKLGVEVQELPQGPWETLWREYVRDTKGLRQVTTSRGLTLSDDDIEDDDPENTEDQPTPLAALGSSTLKHLDRNRTMPDLLELVEQPAAAGGGMARLRLIERWLIEHVCDYAYIDCDWAILWPAGSPEAERDRLIREERVRRRDTEIAEVLTESDQWFAAKREELEHEGRLRVLSTSG
jgi:hypothetical protein